MTFAMLTGPARRGTSICRRPRRRPYEGIGDTNEGIVDTKVLETCGAPRAAISYMTNPLHVACRQAPDASGNRAQLAPVEIHETVERNQTEDRFLPADLESRREKGRLRLLLGLNEAVASNLPLQEMIRAMVASLRAGVRCEVVAGFLSDDVAVEYSKAVAEIADLKARHAVEDLAPDGDDRDELHFGRIVGASSALRRALKQVETVSRTDSTVIVHGETGTGDGSAAPSLLPPPAAFALSWTRFARAFSWRAESALAMITRSNIEVRWVTSKTSTSRALMSSSAASAAFWSLRRSIIRGRRSPSRTVRAPRCNRGPPRAAGIAGCAPGRSGRGWRSRRCRAPWCRK